MDTTVIVDGLPDAPVAAEIWSSSACTLVSITAKRFSFIVKDERVR